MGGAIKDVNPNMLVTCSILSNNPLVQPGNYEQILAARNLDMLDLHFYPGNPDPLVQLATARKYKVPVLWGEMGMPQDMTRDAFTGYQQAFSNMAAFDNNVGVLSWGQQFVAPDQTMIYTTTDGFQFGPNSPQQEIFMKY